MCGIGAARISVGRVVIRSGQVAAQSRIGMGITHSTQTCITAVIEATVGQFEVKNKGPDVGVMPVDDRMDAYKIGPSMVGVIEVGKFFSVRVRSSCSDEDGLHIGVLG